MCSWIRPLFASLFLTAIASILLACGSGVSSSSCQITGLNVSPASGTADHTAIAPGNQVQFGVSAKLPQGCVQNFAALLAMATWTTSDPVNTNIVNPPNGYGLVTCVGATPQPATITASLGNGNLSGTATLVCR